MRNSEFSLARGRSTFVHARKLLPVIFALSSSVAAQSVSSGAGAQTAKEGLAERIQALNAAVQREEEQVKESQRQVDELRRQLNVLQSQLQASTASTPLNSSVATPASASISGGQAPTASETAKAIADIREHQAVQDSEIATHDQAKVESASKYPLKLTGLLLLNGFINTHAVDLPATPTVSLDGSGNSGISIRQTLLGFEAHGPHLWGAASSADLHVDFGGTAQSAIGTSAVAYNYATAETLVRLRTAHARLAWNRAQAYFALDRPLVSPDSPISLTAIAEPALAWSGNLWMWNPQAGFTEDLPSSKSTTLRLQAALIDVADAPLTPLSGQATSAENSRWPGVQARIALLGTGAREDSTHFGVGGYFAPHLSPFGRRYDAWAVTLDGHIRLGPGLSITSSAYRGLALGGMGAGTYKDVLYAPRPGGSGYYSRPLDDVGGWVQLQQKFNERLQLNAAFGTDQGFAHELRRYAVPTNTYLQNLARNNTWTANFIYSPSSYLLFSVEYRHLKSAPVLNQGYDSNIFGAAAGYRF